MDIKLHVTGSMRHGKDTISEKLAELLNLTFASSSLILNEEVIYPALKDQFDYRSPMECYQNRGNHRELWFNLLANYNKDDLARLGKLIFSKHDIYCGLRSRKELLAMKEIKLFDYLIWVDASDRLPPEPPSSMTITIDDADYVINNNGTLIDLEEEIYKLINWLIIKEQFILLNK